MKLFSKIGEGGVTMEKFVTGNATFAFLEPRRKHSLARRFHDLLVNLYYTLRIRLTTPMRNEKRKFHISLCTMFKDEAPYLREWIEFHRIVGVDHFYMYNNNSSDGFEKELAFYTKEGIVTLIPWTKEHAQVEGFEDCIRRFQGESDWIGFIDVDEFLVPVEEESLTTFLDRFARCPSVFVYWRFFGSNGMLSRDRSRLVTEDFVVASEKLYGYGKSFFNSNYDYLWNSDRNRTMFHRLWTVYHGKALPPTDMFGRAMIGNWPRPVGTKKIPIQLNHYAIKSLEEHRDKDKKGDVFFDHPTHGDSVFFNRDLRCNVPDYRIYKYLSTLKYRLAEIEKRNAEISDG